MVVLWLGASHLAVAQQEDDEAKKRFLQGVALFQDEHYEGALVEFQASYDANPKWGLHYNLGLTLQALHRYVEAAEQFELYLEKGGDEIEPDRRVEVEEILDDLQSVIGKLDVNCDVEGADVYLDGEKVATTPLDAPIRTDVGEYQVVVEKPGFVEFTVKVSVPGNASVTVDVQMTEVTPEEEPVPEEPAPEEPAPEPQSRKLGKGPFVAMLVLTAAAGLSAVATGTVTLIRNKKFYDTAFEDTQRWSDLRDSGKKLALATDVLLGVTAAAAVTTVVLAIFTDFAKKEKPSEAVTLAPILGGGTVGLMLSAPLGGM